MSLAGETELSAITQGPQALARISLGVMSPVWGMFASAAVSGAAWWWMTRWARPANPEAIFDGAKALPAEIQAKVEALAAPVVEAIEDAPAVLEAVAGPAVEVMEVAQATVAPVMDAPTPAPLPKAKKAAPKLD